MVNSNTNGFSEHPHHECLRKILESGEIPTPNEVSKFLSLKKMLIALGCKACAGYVTIKQKRGIVKIKDLDTGYFCSDE